MVDEPERRREIDAGLQDVYRDLSIAPSRARVKAALNLLGIDVGGRRGCRCGARRAGDGDVTRDARAPRAACKPPRAVSGTLRVLPLGGLGEIGKNMTVVEYDGRIVVVDTGLRFPTADMMGIDLVLPDFTYLRERADDIEAIVITHGHEDHLGALPWVLRELGDLAAGVYGGRLTVAMARSKLDEHRLRDADARGARPGERLDARPVRDRARPHDPLDPRLVRGGADAPSSGTVLFTGDYKFDQTPVDGRRPTSRGSPSSAARGVLLLCGDSTNADRPGLLAVASAGSGRTSRRCSRALPGRSS